MRTSSRIAATAGQRAKRSRVGVTFVALLAAVVLAACDGPGIDLGAPESPSTGQSTPEVIASEVPSDGDGVAEEPPADAGGEVSDESEPGDEPADPDAGAPAAEGELVGFASVEGGTTGGAGGETIAVSTAEEFLDAISSEGPAVVQVSGTIELSGMNDVASDKTIEGDGTIAGGGLTLSGVSNVVIRNLTFTGADDDSINIEEGSTNIWIDHNDFSNGFDGLVDIKRGSDFITVSWNHFHDHDKTALLGHSDDNAAQDEGHLRVTYHHNWFDGTNQRHPRVRFGDPVHVYNNYYAGVGSYGIASTMGAGVVAEGNYFEGVDSPIVTQTGDSDSGNVVERDNVYDGSGEPETAGSATEPSTFYDYTLDDPASIPEIVSSGAGPQ